MMENPDGDIGRILKERREELGRTLQNAEEKTRIRKTYLESLENNRFSELPGQTYVTGFIRVYANYLGLKSNPLLSMLNDHQSVAVKPAQTGAMVAGKAGHDAEACAPSDWRKFFLAFVLVLLLGSLIYFLTATLSSDEQLNESVVKGTEAGETPAESSKTQAAPEKSPAVPKKPQTSATGQAQSDKPEVQLPAYTSVAPVASAEQQERDRRKLPVIPPDGASLRMLALADSSLIIKVDERKPHEFKLYDGLDLTWKIKQKVNVDLPASGVARFWLNGQEIDIAGDQSFTLQPAAE